MKRGLAVDVCAVDVSLTIFEESDCVVDV